MKVICRGNIPFTNLTPNLTYLQQPHRHAVLGSEVDAELDSKVDVVLDSEGSQKVHCEND